MSTDLRESRLTVHRRQLAQRVSVAGCGGRQHCQAEGRGHGRRDPALVGHELQRGGTSSRKKRSPIFGGIQIEAAYHGTRTHGIGDLILPDSNGLVPAETGNI